MARNLTPIAKVSRREGVALHPKAVKALTRKPYIPGVHGQSRRPKPGDYATRLREKQKVKRMYGMLEKQFRRYVREAERLAGVSGENLVRLLESRLDNAIYRAGLAPSRQGARQLVTHAHLQLNGKKVNIPSIILRPGDEITVRPSSQKNAYFTKWQADTNVATLSAPSWLSLDAKKLTIKVTSQPLRQEVSEEIAEQLIIEFYSR